MGLRESVRAASLLNAARFMPIHYDTFPLIEVDTDEWQDMMAESGHETVVLSPGESIEV